MSDKYTYFLIINKLTSDAKQFEKHVIQDIKDEMTYPGVNGQLIPGTSIFCTPNEYSMGAWVPEAMKLIESYKTGDFNIVVVADDIGHRGISGPVLEFFQEHGVAADWGPPLTKTVDTGVDWGPDDEVVI